MGRKRESLIRDVACETEHEFLDAISPRSRYFEEGEPYRVLYRGHADARFELLRLLAFEGVSAAELFPGYGGVVKALGERRLWLPED